MQPDKNVWEQRVARIEKHLARHPSDGYAQTNLARCQAKVEAGVQPVYEGGRRVR